MQKFLFLAMATLTPVSMFGSVSAQVVMRQSVAGGDGVFHLKELQTIISSENDTLRVLMMLPTNMRPEGYTDIEIKNQDEILMVNKKRVKSVKTLEKMYDELEIGSEFKMGIRRNGKLTLVAFKKIDPADLPTDQHVQIRTASEADSEGDEGGLSMRTFMRDDPELANLRRPLFGTGLMLGFENGKVTIAEVLDHMERTLGKVDLQQGDVVESLNGVKAESLDQIADLYEKSAVGTKIELGCFREGNRRTVSFEKPEVNGRVIMRQE